MEIATAFESCLEQNSIDKVTIADITKTSGLTRQTFYHYFTNKTELVSWVNLGCMQKAFYGEEMFEWQNAFLKLFQLQKKHLILLQRALSSELSTMIYQQLYDGLHNLYYSVMRYRLCHTPPTELTLLLDSYCTISVDMIIDWITNHADLDQQVLINLLSRRMPAQIKLLATERKIPVKQLVEERELLGWAYS
jgi:AcrR family transcriptional regulator